jgi:hypothetical protein
MITFPAKVVLFSAIASSALGADSDSLSGAVATADPTLQPKGAHLTLRSVLQLAQAEASTHGISSASFEATQFSYGCQNDKKCEWSILYVGKKFTWQGQPAQPSMIPIVIVNDRTRRAHLLGPPPFVKVDSDDVLKRIIKGVWKTHPDGPAISFEITGGRPHHFKFRVLSKPYCEALPIDQYALTVGYEPPLSKTDLRVTSAQIKFDGDWKKTNCIGMPAWITFKFSSPLNHNAAKVIVREQFAEGPDESEYEMVRRR